MESGTGRGARGVLKYHHSCTPSLKLSSLKSSLALFLVARARDRCRDTRSGRVEVRSVRPRTPYHVRYSLYLF